MVPSGNVVTLAIAVVLQADGGREVAVCKHRVQSFDFVVEGHVMHSLPLQPENKLNLGLRKEPPQTRHYFDKNTTLEKCLNNVMNNVKNGSIIVFHDSEKAKNNLLSTLPRVLDYYSKQGYLFEAITL